MNIINLKCGYRANPVQISREEICFSWSTEGAGAQKAYRLQISHEENFKIIYVDTQKVKSSSNRFIKVKAKLSQGTKYYWRVKIYAQNVEEWSPIQSFETKRKGFDAEWIACTDERDPQKPAPSTRFRKDFTCKGEVKKARLFASAQGLYVSYINGKKCGDEYLTPGFTQYDGRIQYQTYDVTHLIGEGKNCLAAAVSDGWYMGPMAGWMDGSGRCKFGDTRAFFAQLEIDYKDGSYDVIATDDTWQSDMKSMYTRCEIYYGADYDWRLEDGFFSSGYISQDNTAIIKQKAALVPQQGVPVREIKSLSPVKIFTTPNGETVADMGQNMVGIPEITAQGRLGQEIELVFFETLDENGNVYTENLRSARQGLYYVMHEGENVFRPEMTFYGFRYIHIKKWPGEVLPQNIKGIVLSSDMEQTGSFSTNDELVNRFEQNVVWGQLGNYVDIPTDCPQRDERLGWTGDAQVFIKAAALNFDVLGFFHKWLADMELAQRKNGSIPHVVPKVKLDESCSCGWGEACVIIPWQLYESYGDIEILNRFYPMMQSFMEYRQSTAESSGIINSGEHYGDWLALDCIKDVDSWKGSTPIEFICTAFYAHAADIMSRVADVLGKKGDSKKYADLFSNTKEAFNKEFVTPSGRLLGHTQTAHVLALKFNLLNPAAKVRSINDLVHMIEEYGFITCGFLGSPHVLDVLSSNGHHDLALKMALRQDYPSWLYPVTMGATTIWERWNGIMPDGTLNTPAMNSMNHYSYGAVLSWYYEQIAGIKTDPNSPGYKHFYIDPQPCKELGTVDCRLKTHFGTIRVYYEMTENNVRMQVKIPDNTTAHLKLSECKVCSIGSVRKRYTGSILLKSGEYDISYVKGGSFLSLVPER